MRYLDVFIFGVGLSFFLGAPGGCTDQDRVSSLLSQLSRSRGDPTSDNFVLVTPVTGTLVGAALQAHHLKFRPPQSLFHLQEVVNKLYVNDLSCFHVVGKPSGRHSILKEFRFYLNTNSRKIIPLTIPPFEAAPSQADQLKALNILFASLTDPIKANLPHHWFHHQSEATFVCSEKIDFTEPFEFHFEPMSQRSQTENSVSWPSGIDHALALHD